MPLVVGVLDAFHARLLSLGEMIIGLLLLGRAVVDWYPADHSALHAPTTRHLSFFHEVLVSPTTDLLSSRPG
jgi:hypothetical protein